MKQVQQTLAGNDEVDRRRSLGKRVKQRSLGKESQAIKPWPRGSSNQEVCQCDGSNQVLARESSNQVLARESSNQALAKRVKQSSLGQEGQAIKKSVGSDSKQGVLARRLAEQVGSLGQKIG